MMTNDISVEVEALFAAHIARLETLVAGRDKDNPWHGSLNAVDRKNINSLREGRVPEYSDHMANGMCEGMPMTEFMDIVEEQKLVTLA